MELWQTLSGMVIDWHLTAPCEAELGWDWTVALYGEVLAIAGGKERIRFYLNNYRPDFELPTNLDRFVPSAAKPSITNNW